MPSILSLPIEIISYVSRELDVPDLSAFSRSCRALHNIVTPHLYRQVKDDAGIICWAIDEGKIGTVERLLVAGANPNIAWVQSGTRDAVLAALEACKPRTHPLGLSPQSQILAADIVFGTRTRRRRLSIDSDMIFPSDEEDEEDEYEYDFDFMRYGHHHDLLYDNHFDNHLEPVTRRRGYETPGDLTKNCYWTPLHVAARWGNDDIINLLIKYGADVNSLSKGFCNCLIPNSAPWMYSEEDPREPIWTPLHTAMCNGRESTARLLISRGASMNVSPRLLGSDSRHITALHTACYSDLISVARFIIDEGYQTDVEVQDHNGSTPMSYAYFAGNWRSIDFLVEQGASVNATLNSLTLLKHACRECRFAEALRFIELGVDISASFESLDATEPILHCCCGTPRPTGSSVYQRESRQEDLRVDVVKALIKAGADIEARNAEMLTPLMKAALVNVDNVVEVLLDEGADIDAQDNEGETALLKACNPLRMLGDYPKGAMRRTVAKLLDRIPPDTDIFEALETVCTSTGSNSDKIEVTRMLFQRERSASRGPKNKHDQELFTAALLASNIELCDELLKHTSREFTQSEIDTIIDLILISDNSSALEYILKLPQARKVLMRPNQVLDTIRMGKEECAIYLIEAGAPINYRSENDETCLLEACKLHELELAEILLGKGADPNEVVGDRYPLMEAVMNENLVMVEVLLDYGANMHRHPKCNKTDDQTLGPLDLAIIRGLEDVVETMVRHKSFLEATDEERVAHLETACCACPDAYDDGIIVEILLSKGTLDPNTVFPKLNATPLHISMALDRLTSVTAFVQAGANIHYQLSLADYSEPSPVPNPFKGSTPLEWAIDNVPLEYIEELIGNDNNESNDKFTRDPQMVLRYIRAACRRHKPEVLLLLLDSGLDPFIFDEDNSVLNIFCQTMDKIWPFEDPDWPASKIAARSAKCVNILLTRGVDQHKKNIHGVSALDNIRRMMTYDGAGEFHREVVKYLNEELVLLETEVRPKTQFQPDRDSSIASEPTFW